MKDTSLGEKSFDYHEKFHKNFEKKVLTRDLVECLTHYFSQKNEISIRSTCLVLP